MAMRRRPWLLLSLAALLAGCSGGSTAPEPEKPADKPKEETPAESDPKTTEAPKDPDMLPVDPNLKIEDVKVGTGATAKPGRTAYVLYRGSLMDGKVFDSNDAPEKDPFAFQIGAAQVIKGWDQGVQGMKVGGVRKLTIPSDLAYGLQGSPPTIPANATLQFTVTLLDVLKTEDRNTFEVTPVKAGTGAKPKPGDTVTIEYTGKLINGKQFDTSKGRGPLTFEVGVKAVVGGLDSGVQEMQAGGTYKLWIGPDAAYGPMGKPPAVPANSILQFDIELKSVKPKK